MKLESPHSDEEVDNFFCHVLKLEKRRFGYVHVF